MNARRLAPSIVAAALGAAYVAFSPASQDLAAHLLRAKLFAAEGFGLWSNWWYGGGHDVLYSVLFPALGATLSPQLVAAIAVTAGAAVFEVLARQQFGPRAWVGATWFAAALAASLYTGRLAFAFGMLPAIATALALARGRWGVATALAFLTALCSPVAALFAALAGAAHALAALAQARPRRGALPGAAVAAAALVPLGALAIAFPEGGTMPFSAGTFWPVVVIGVAALAMIPRAQPTLIAGVGLYVAGCVAAYVLPTAIGSNAARLGELAAGPLAALLWWRRRTLLLAVVAIPLLYIQWHEPVHDVVETAGNPAVTSAYYQPLISFLQRQGGPPFRVEIPFTRFHWEAYAVAPHFPLARGWERQLDRKYNALFYGATLDQASYEAWLHELAVRFVAVPDTALDYSALGERALIDRGLPYLTLVEQTPHWRIYAVAHPTPLVQGAAVLEALGANSLTLRATAAGTAFVRVRFTPFWALGQGAGCVAPWGQFTQLQLRHPGPVRLVIRFAIGRIGARSARCS